MQIKFTLGTHEEPEAYAKARAILDVLSGQAQAVRSGDAAVEADVARQAAENIAAAETLAKLEAENPQFGQQPLPPGAAPLCVVCGEPQYGTPSGPTCANGHGGAESLPLAPSVAPAPAVVEALMSAPAAAPASIPPPPPAASAVPSPPPAAATPAPVGAVDAKGLPWDERIHASSRAKIADGSWRMKRGVQSHVVEAVEAELRAQSMQPGTIADPVAYAAAKAAGTVTEIIPPPPAAPAPAPAPLPPGPPALTFGIVASRIGKAVTAGTLSGNVLSVKLAELGFPDGLHTVNSRPDMWQKILDTLGA